jgi:16S rRNA (uracil1498-N3)-methyltransferase
MPLAFVADLDVPELDPADHHHLSRVVRVRNGAECVVSDGRGRWRLARFGQHPEPTGPIETDPSPPWSVTVAFAPVKGGPESTVQKLTELGVERIVPIITERSVVRWDERRAAKLAERLDRIARESSMQSRRVRLPVVDAPVALRSFLSSVPASEAAGLAMADPDGVPVSAAHRVVLIGPEGGWSDSERSGAALVSLPGGVLRAETAAIVAATILVLHRQNSKASRY